MDRTELIHDSVQQRASVNATTKSWVP